MGSSQEAGLDQPWARGGRGRLRAWWEKPEARGVARALGHSVTTVQMLGGDRTHTFAHSFKQLDCSTGLLWGL